MLAGGIYNPKKITLTLLAPAGFTLVAGADEWVDTDVSATTGTDVRKIWIIQVIQQGGQWAGARPHGSALNITVRANQTTMLITTVDTTGHMDFYRNLGSDTVYRIIGYLI